jgi:hypothetical protein
VCRWLLGELCLLPAARAQQLRRWEVLNLPPMATTGSVLSASPKELVFRDVQLGQVRAGVAQQKCKRNKD